MYGQMTAGSWIYIGSQGIVQGTYETFGAVARAHFGGSLAGRFVLTSGLGGMGGAQPLAATMQGAVMLGVEVDPARIEKRLATGYCDRMTASLDEALAWIDAARAGSTALSVGLVGNAAEVLPELVSRGVTPDVVTDQTSAHDMLNGYVPALMSLEEAAALRASDPAAYVARATRDAVRARARDAGDAGPRRDRVRLRQQHPHRRVRRGARRRVHDSRVRARVHPAALLRGEGAVPLGRALRRSGRHRAHRPASRSSSSRTTGTCARGSRRRASASSSRGCRRASAGSARATARSSASRSTTSSRAARSARRS